MDVETKLNIEHWQLKLEDEIKYITSIENNYTYILTQKNFLVYSKIKDKETLLTYPIPENPDIDPNNNNKNNDFINNRIWPDKFGTHIIFKLDSVCYYYNSNFQEKKKIKKLKSLLDENKNKIEPLALSFNNINKNAKITDEIIFSDLNCVFYSLLIKSDNKDEINEKLNMIIDLKNININKKEEALFENNELDKLFDDNYFFIDKDDKIFDIKLFIKEEKDDRNKKVINKNYYIFAVTKRIFFLFKGKNNLMQIFNQYKINNIYDTKKLFAESKIYPKVSNSNKIKLENPRLQIFKPKNKKQTFLLWNNEIGFNFSELNIESNQTDKLINAQIGFIEKAKTTVFSSPNILTEEKTMEEINVYKYMNLKEKDFSYPTACVSSSRCVYFLYSNYLLIYNKITNQVIHAEFFKENDYIDMFFNTNLNKIIIYSGHKIIKISLKHEYDILWKDYIQVGEFSLALDAFPYDDENFKAKLHKLKADYLFNKKEYEEAAMEYALSNENFEHVCLKFAKLSDSNHLFNYLNFVNKLKIYKIIKDLENKENNEKEKEKEKEKGKEKEKEKILWIQKYLINTWLLEIILEQQDEISINKNNNKKNTKNEIQTMRQLLFESGYIDSEEYIDKLIIYNSLRYFGRHSDFVDFAGFKNDYREIVFDMVNHNQYKNAIKNLISYIYYNDTSESLSKEVKEKNSKGLIKLFIMYNNVFVKESPGEVIDLLNEYYYLIENPKQILRIIINLDDIYKNKMDDFIYDKTLKLIKKLMQVSKNYRKDEINSLIFDEASKQNLFSLYVLYLSKSVREIHFEELNNYLMQLIKDMNRYYISNKTYFEFSFAEHLFKNNKSALALLYCLKKQYNKSILHSFKCTNETISVFIASSISNPKKKKEIWLAVFNHYKSLGMKKVEEILQKSKGILTITDILPHLMDNVQLKDIEINLNKCIDDYEIKLKRLKKSIKDYSKSEEIINKKIGKQENNGQKCLKVKSKEINCSICLKNLNQENFYLFPCRHAFDFNCIINLLFSYDKKEIEDEKFKNKMSSINSIFEIIKQIKKNKKNIFEQMCILNNKYLNKLKTYMKHLALKYNITEQIIFDMNNSDKTIELMLNDLDDLISDDCPLCGNELILDTQNKFGNEDNRDWMI